MARKGENIYKRKDGRWEGRYVSGKKPNGKTAFGYVYGKKYADVKSKLLVIKAKYEVKTFEKENEEIWGNGSVSIWMEYWLEKEIKPNVKASTYAIYRGQVEKHILPILGDKPIRNIEKKNFNMLYLSILEKGISCMTARNICKRFLASLSSAREHNLILNLPTLPIKKQKDIKKKAKFLSVQEQMKLEEKLSESSKKDIAVLTSLYTGMRIGEECALQWGDVNLNTGIVSVSHTLQRVGCYEKNQKTELIYQQAKSESSMRDIPIPHFLVEILANLKVRTKGESKDFVFGRGDIPIEPRVLQYYLKKIQISIGLKDVHYHTLRHTFATRFMEKVKDIQALKEILGHSSAKLTMEWYGHSTEQHKQQSMELLSKNITVA